MENSDPTVDEAFRTKIVRPSLKLAGAIVDAGPTELNLSTHMPVHGLAPFSSHEYILLGQTVHMPSGP